ncbi:MAG: 30S ribosomal protein S10 [Spirochaetes bacterium]|nr:30S ribosomal protein S10 [Spirochaetota bacterium]NLJ04234.1 30S ribosomal protein S10 [Exilispira sp.]MBP8990841.1 30S ribosomal protein S10 [Spirochaetota bacterium]HOV45584.1 30S ribosomal protein S10 [Exilispira sp.]HQM88672.1 30S ribosomal protein S10 [Exilispira sp.]
MKNSKIRIKLQAYDHVVLDKSAAEIVKTLKKAKAVVRGPIPLPTKIRRYTVLRSPFVHVESREQFEIRTHKRMIDIIDPSEEAKAALMGLELPQGVYAEVKQL